MRDERQNMGNCYPQLNHDHQINQTLFLCPLEELCVNK